MMDVTLLTRCHLIRVLTDYKADKHATRIKRLLTALFILQLFSLDEELY